MLCKHCGQAIQETARFCTHCGSPVEASPPTGTVAAPPIAEDTPHHAAPSIQPGKTNILPFLVIGVLALIAITVTTLMLLKSWQPDSSPQRESLDSVLTDGPTVINPTPIETPETPILHPDTDNQTVSDRSDTAIVTDDEAFLGDWKWETNLEELGLEGLTEIMSNEEVAELLETYGVVNLRITQDNRFTMEVYGELIEGTWQRKSDTILTLIVDGDPADAVLTDGKLVLREDDISMTFIR